MAGRNGSGPMGEGPMTGRGSGYCNADSDYVKANQSGHNGQIYARGAGRGLRQGYGKGNAYGKELVDKGEFEDFKTEYLRDGLEKILRQLD